MVETTENKIKELLESILENTPMFFVDMELKGNKGSRTLWIYVDSEEGGINLDQCARLSEELGLLVEAHQMIDGRYRLNVSSPGLDRPLVDKRQYKKNEGRKASVKCRIGEEVKTIKGILKKAEDEQLVIEQDNKKEQVIIYDDIIETKILAAW